MVAMEKRLERTCDGAMAEGIGILDGEYEGGQFIRNGSDGAGC
jgi:hypothetical protein